MERGAGTVVVDDLLSVLSRPDDPELSEIVRLAADLCDADAAGLTIRDGDEFHIPVTHGVQPMVCAAEETFCVHTMTMDGVYFVRDAHLDPRFANISWVDGRFALTRFYASAPVYDPSGQMVGRLCVIAAHPKDLSPLQVRALDALAHTLTQIIETRLARAGRVPGAGESQASMAMMSHLAAELSHDLRVPLTSIQASVEMLSDALSESGDPTVAMLLSRAGSAATRMSRMLEQVMHFGSVDDNPELGEVDLAKLLSQLVLDSASLLEAQGARVDWGVLPVVRANADEAYSLFQNLISNSAKFGRPGTPVRIRVDAVPVDERWRIDVSDNGVGIPADRRSDVFTLFSRVDQSVEGHGIGLATAARIVRAHGGTISADDAPGGGTVISFDLPSRTPRLAHQRSAPPR